MQNHYHYYIVKRYPDPKTDGTVEVAHHWFSVDEIHHLQADREVDVRLWLFSKNKWVIVKTPPMPTVPSTWLYFDTMPKLHVWPVIDEETLRKGQRKFYPYSYMLWVASSVAKRYGNIKVAYFLGMWPKYEEWVKTPDDPNIWPVRGLLTSGNIAIQPWLRHEMEYKWRFEYRHKGRRQIPGGNIPLYFIDECYFLDAFVALETRGCSDRGLPWTEFEHPYRMTVFDSPWLPPNLIEVQGEPMGFGLRAG